MAVNKISQCLEDIDLLIFFFGLFLLRMININNQHGSKFYALKSFGFRLIDASTRIYTPKRKSAFGVQMVKNDSAGRSGRPSNIRIVCRNRAVRFFAPLRTPSSARLKLSCVRLSVSKPALLPSTALELCVITLTGWSCNVVL